MEFEDLTDGTEFIEDGKQYIVVRNVSKWLRVQSPCGDFTLVYRPIDNGLTFRGGTIPENVLKNGLTVPNPDNRICPKCRKEVHYIQLQGIRHCQMTEEIEVCTDCKSEFIRANDSFFKGLI